MAKAKTSATTSFLKKSPKKRPGIHSKRGTSKNKSSKNYKKPYAAQGK
jgi:hypothetical protein